MLSPWQFVQAQARVTGQFVDNATGLLLDSKMKPYIHLETLISEHFLLPLLTLQFLDKVAHSRKKDFIVNQEGQTSPQISLELLSWTRPTEFSSAGGLSGSSAKSVPFIIYSYMKD